MGAAEGMHLRKKGLRRVKMVRAEESPGLWGTCTEGLIVIITGRGCGLKLAVCQSVNL